MNDPNPYAPPSQVDDAQAVRAAALREIVLGWEKLRLLYNAILLVPGLGILAFWTMKNGMPAVAAFVSGLLVVGGANASFFLGPLAELYFRGLFRNGESIGKGRWLIFGAGIVVSAGVFLVALLGGLAVAQFPQPA